ncbi:IclR family transcriptional regulator, partial [bacterium M00.F.Ca.ET.155.01.1.1]
LYLYGMAYMRGNDLLRRGRQEVDTLSRETGETSELCMLQSGRYTIVHSSPGMRPFRISSATGLQIPLPWTASGRLLLAGLDRGRIEAMVTQDDLVLPDGRKIALDDFIDD